MSDRTAGPTSRSQSPTRPYGSSPAWTDSSEPTGSAGWSTSTAWRPSAYPFRKCWRFGTVSPVTRFNVGHSSPVPDGRATLWIIGITRRNRRIERLHPSGAFLIPIPKAGRFQSCHLGE